MDHPIGFNNPNSICYFNALLQALLTLSTFQPYQTKEGDEITSSYSSHLLSKIQQTLGLSSSSQESSSEYLYFLIDYFDKLYPDDLLTKRFSYGHLYRYTCGKCHKEWITKEQSCCMMIEDGLEEIFYHSQLIDHYTCDHTVEKVKTILQSVRCLERLGDVLIVSLNKYQSKKKTKYPHYFTLEGKRYDLVATVDHYGQLEGGHYVARVKRGSRYYQIDDLSVSPIDEIYNQDTTYMLFYERTSK